MKRSRKTLCFGSWQQEVPTLSFEKVLNMEQSRKSSSGKVVDCILCLKGYYEWRQSGGVHVWKYGGTVRITSFPKGSPSSLLGSESADESRHSLKSCSSIYIYQVRYHSRNPKCQLTFLF